MATDAPAPHCLGDTHLRWPRNPSATPTSAPAHTSSPCVSTSCMFHMDDLAPELDRIPLDCAHGPPAHTSTHTSAGASAARQLRATRITATVDGRPGGLLAFQKDRVSVGSAAFDDITLTREQAFPSAFSVTRFDDCFEVHNEDEEDIFVNGMRLPYANRVCTTPGVPVVVSGGLRDNFSVTLRAVSEEFSGVGL